MTAAKVSLWGRTIGAVSLDENQAVANFQYDPAFVRSGIEIAPLMMPLSNKIFRFGDLPAETFRGLPGLLADSLPDKFGNALIDQWLAASGRSASSFNAIERLCYTGQRGMGALEYAPVLGSRARKNAAINIDRLVGLASEVLENRGQLSTSFASPNRERALKEILAVGTSAGGARAKAIVAIHRDTQEVRSGQINAGDGFDYWLIKFDGVDGNKDKELADPKGFGALEYAYYLMASAAGINMSECKLLEENGRRHFLTKRFDRLSNGGKLHMQSLGAIAHYDFNSAGAYSYEQALLVIRNLGLSMSDIEAQFRRMVFNVVARNQDDHVKNIAFLMDQSGAWSLAPAFDITYSFNPNGSWTSSHQMTVNNKRDHFTREDFRACAKAALMKRGRADAIVDEVVSAVMRWPEFAQLARVNELWARQIKASHRIDWN